MPFASSDLPDGAHALLVALATPAPRGTTGIPVLLWGRPGVGKSSFIEGLADGDLRVTTLIASIHDPTDFSGLPVLDNGSVRYAAPRWVSDFGERGNGILFLDELSTAPPSVQAALLRVVFERRVGFTPLPDGVRIVAAANPPDLMVGGWELSPPLRNRFVHLNWDIPAALYRTALTDGWARATVPRIDPRDHARALEGTRVRVAGFLRLHPGFLHGDPEQERFGFASPRTWDYAASLLAACEVLGLRAGAGDANGQGVLLQLLGGCLGEGVAIPFLEYLRDIRLPAAEDLLDGKEQVSVAGLNDSELYVLLYEMRRVLLSGLDSPALAGRTAVFLQYVTEVFANGRRDVIFAPLRDLARSNWIAAVAANPNEAERERAMAYISEVFSDAAFSEFIDVLG